MEASPKGQPADCSLELASRWPHCLHYAMAFSLSWIGSSGHKLGTGLFQVSLTSPPFAPNNVPHEGGQLIRSFS